MTFEEAIAKSREGDHTPLWGLFGEFGVKSLLFHRYSLNLLDRIPEDEAPGTAYLVLIDVARTFKLDRNTKASFKTYYNSALRNYLCHLIRRDKRFPAQEPIVHKDSSPKGLIDLMPAPEPFDPRHSEPVSSYVKKKVLGCLTPKTRNILISVYGHEAPQSWVSEWRKIAPVSLRSRIQQAKRKVRDSISPEVAEYLCVR